MARRSVGHVVCLAREDKEGVDKDRRKERERERRMRTARVGYKQPLRIERGTWREDGEGGGGAMEGEHE